MAQVSALFSEYSALSHLVYDAIRARVYFFLLNLSLLQSSLYRNNSNRIIPVRLVQ